MTRPAVRMFPVCLAAMLAMGSAQAAHGAVVKGSLTGAKPPAEGKGDASVRAVALKTGAVVAAKHVARRRFSLTVPRGPIALLTSMTQVRPGGTNADRLGYIFPVKKKGRRGLELPLGPKKKRRGSANASARPGFVDVDHPAIWIKHFTVTGDPALSPVGKGLADMLITDLAGVDCETNPAVVEREHLKEVLAELELQRSRYVDPATRVPTGRLVEHNTEITGQLVVSGENIAMYATVTDLRSGKRQSVSVSGPRESFFELEPQLAEKLREIICTPQAPPLTITYEGSQSTHYQEYQGDELVSEETCEANWSLTFEHVVFEAYGHAGSTVYGSAGRWQETEVVDGTAYEVDEPASETAFWSVKSSTKPGGFNIFWSNGHGCAPGDNEAFAFTLDELHRGGSATRGLHPNVSAYEETVDGDRRTVRRRSYTETVTVQPER